MKMTNTENIYHTDSLNTLEKLESFGFSGIDVSLEISLFDYELLWKEIEKGKWLFIYSIGNGNYDRIEVDQETFICSDLDWIYREGYEEFLKTNGYSSKEIFDQMSFPSKVYDLYQYYGYENIFGASYWEGFKIYRLEQIQELWEKYATLEVCDSHGIYIPQIFVSPYFEERILTNEGLRVIKDNLVESFEDCLDEESETYWDSWQEILDNFEYRENGKTFTLHQDGDLFLVDSEFYEKTENFPPELLDQFWNW